MACAPWPTAVPLAALACALSPSAVAFVWPVPVPAWACPPIAVVPLLAAAPPAFAKEPTVVENCPLASEAAPTTVAPTLVAFERWPRALASSKSACVFWPKAAAFGPFAVADCLPPWNSRRWL